MATNLSALEAAMSDLDARIMSGPKPIEPVSREQYAAARADLEARARAGKTIQGRNSKGHFTRGVKTFTAGVAPVVQAPVKVENPLISEARRIVTVERDRRASVVGLSAEA